MTKELELHHIGDRELWYAKAADATWTLPMYVDWKHDKKNDKYYALIVPACALYHTQMITMCALMEMHDLMGEKNRWLVPQNIARAILHKAPGITPAMYYLWPDAACPPLPPKWGMSKFRLLEQDPKRVVQAEGFMKHLSVIHRIPIDLVKTVFAAIEESAPRYMLKERRPLELGFCRLIAAPFRSNWKEIVAYKAKGLRLPSIFSLSMETMWKALECIGMPGLLCSPDNIGLKRCKNFSEGDHRVSYVIEAIPNDKFEKACNEVEEERITCGRTKYVAIYEEAVEKLYKYLVQALSSYVKKAAIPFAAVLQSGKAGDFGLCPLARKHAQAEDGAFLSKLPVHIIPPVSKFSVFGKKSDPRLVQAKDEALQAVRDLPPGIKNMRKSELSRELDRLIGETESNGVPVLDAVQSETDGPKMLPSS